MKQFDIAVLGGGPGGYVAAIRAAKEGQSVALIEADELGGTCLNRGCIPSKTLLKQAEVVNDIKKFEKWGVKTNGLQFSLEQMMGRKDQVIHQLRRGISSLLNANKIEVYRGFGTIQQDCSIDINLGDVQQKIHADRIIIATGSRPFIPNIPGLDQCNVYTSDTIFDISEIPNSLMIIGGGVIGVEFACIFASLNVKVTIIETEDRIISSEDDEASAELRKSLNRQGIEILTDHEVNSLSDSDNEFKAIIKDIDGNKKNLIAEKVLLAVGRTPNTKGLENLNLEMKGPFIKVNHKMETSQLNVYAVGDVIGGLQLAHVASAEGIIAAMNAGGEQVERDDYFRVVPRCIYTFPQVASVGYTESEAENLGYHVKKVKFPLQGNGRALAMGEDEGFIKVISEEQYGEVVGVVIVGAQATEIISEASSYIFLEGTVEELSKMIHPHPSLSEGFFESANALMGNSIHM